MGTSSANRIFQLNAVGSLNPCDFCCLLREDEEDLGKCYPLFSCPKTVGKISQTLLYIARTPQAQPSVLAWCHILLQPRQGNTAPGSVQVQEPRHRGGWDSREGNRVATVTKPASGWYLQHLWGRTFGVLCAFNVLVQFLWENQALLGLFWGRTRALKPTGMDAPAHPPPGFLPRGHSGRGHSRERGNRRGLSSGGTTIPGRHRACAAAGRKRAGLGPCAPPPLRRPPFCHRLSPAARRGVFFFLKGEAVAKSGPTARPRRYHGRRRSPAARSGRVGRGGEQLSLPGLARGGKGAGGQAAGRRQRWR